MHPAQVLINLHRAKQAGASNPFNTNSDFCDYTNGTCLGCPAEGTCSYITQFGESKGLAWSTSLHDYCGDLIDYTYDELTAEFPEYQI